MCEMISLGARFLFCIRSFIFSVPTRPVVYRHRMRHADWNWNEKEKYILKRKVAGFV